MNLRRLLFQISLLLHLCLASCMSGRYIQRDYREAFLLSQQRLVSQDVHCPGPLALLSEQGERKESMILYTECDKESVRVVVISPLGLVHASMIMKKDVLLEETLGHAFDGFVAEDILLLLFNHCCMGSDVQNAIVRLKDPCRIRIERENRSLTLLPNDPSQRCQEGQVGR